MSEFICYVCSKTNLSKNEIGLTKKFLHRNIKIYYCFDCLSEYLEIDVELLLEKLDEFKNEGCKLF